MSQITFEHRETPELFSVVIPTYHGERYIREALASISSQTDQNWEVIVVEDGSQDATESIVRDFAARHSWHRVHYFRNVQNAGPSHTRNTAFRQVRGQYVALLDSDDRWYPDYLATMRRAFETSGKDIVYCSVIMIEDSTDLLIGVWGPTGGEIADFPHGLYDRNFITPSATVMRRTVLADVGYWNTRYRYCEDLEFWLRCVRAGKTFHYVGGVHCLYRRNHAGAATNRMCAVLEAQAHVVEQFRDLPSIRQNTCQRFVARSFFRAAEHHQRGNQAVDPSVDRSRAPSLYFQAWQFRRKRIDYLWNASKTGLAMLVHKIGTGWKKSRNVTAIAEAPTPASTQSSSRMAA